MGTPQLGPAREGERLGAGEEEFVEALGLYYEGYGLPRIAGRLCALLAIADGPMSIDAMAATLHVSKASVSTNARMLGALGYARRIGLPGDRRDYYIFEPQAWEQELRTSVSHARSIRELALRALERLEPNRRRAHERLEELLVFCDFVETEMPALIARWQSYRSERARAGS